jgi:ribosomal protein S18 acetylase RimI-like enzyme
MNLRKKIFLTVFGFIIVAFLVGFSFKWYGSKHENYNSYKISIRAYEDKDKNNFMRILLDNWFWMIDGETIDNAYKYENQLNTKKTLGYEKEILNVRVITVDNRIAGFSTFHKYDEKVARIQFLCIEKNSRRMHLAEKLIKSVINEIFKNKEIEIIMLTTRSENTRAHNLYKKFGFEEIHTADSEYENDGVTIFVLRRS